MRFVLKVLRVAATGLVLISASIFPSVSPSISPVVAQEMDDPFVRGLKRLETYEGFKRRGSGMGGAGGPIASQEGAVRRTALPGFGQAFNIPRYRLDGILVSEAPLEPVIHLDETGISQASQVLFWSANESRFAYRPGPQDNYETIAAKFDLHRMDILAFNGVKKPEQLDGREVLFVSPPDNGPLIHEICPGETLSKASRVFNIPLKTLSKRNNLTPRSWLKIGDSLNVRDKTITDEMALQAVPAAEMQAQSTMKSERARKDFVRLAAYPEKSEALRLAREFYQQHRDFVDADLTLRHEINDRGEHAYHLDIGPMRSAAHAKSYCVLMTSIEQMCKPVKYPPAMERQTTFESTAIVRVSPMVFYEGDVNDQNIKVEETKAITYNLSEGQMLGASEGTVVKITGQEIIITDASDHLLTLPIDYLPEVDKEELEARAAEERRAQAAAIAAAAAGATDAIELPEVSNPQIVDRLVTNEAKRRKGSTEGVPK